MTAKKAGLYEEPNGKNRRGEGKWGTVFPFGHFSTENTSDIERIPDGIA